MKVIKFGGSSIADTNKLKLAAQKTISFLESGEKVVAILSAQGKTTDNLIKEAKELTDEPNKRELDVLMSVGEQMACSKFAILLHSLGYKAVSLTGWQAGIVTDSNYTEAKIQDIYPKMIWNELENNDVVVVTGFQGINENNNITTLGRGGSDTTAVALSAELNASRCYIYSDVDGIYTADPRKIPNADKLTKISYEEMYSLSSEGAKVLHDRCVEIGEKFDVPIITESTFNDKKGTEITHNLESSGVKSIVKKEISKISVIGYGISSNDDILQKVLEIANENKLEIFNIEITRTKISIIFKEIVDDNILKQIHDVLI